MKSGKVKVKSGKFKVKSRKFKVKIQSGKIQSDFFNNLVHQCKGNKTEEKIQ